MTGLLPLELLVAFDHLTADEREAVLDVDLIGRTYRDVATRIGCSHNHAANLRHRGLAKLRDRLVELGAADDLREAAA